MTGALRWLLILDSLNAGLGYVFGPPQWSSSPTLSVALSLGIPIQWWGALWVLTGTLLLFRRELLAHAVGASVFGFWGGCLWATVATGKITAWGGPGHVTVIAGLHFLALWRLVWPQIKPTVVPHLPGWVRARIERREAGQ